MKKLLNDPADVVPEMLAGLVARSPGLTLLAGENVVVRTELVPARERGVVLISGGGSGHEPAHAGYVGAGMLHAAVAGDVFVSPSVDAVLAAIRATCGPAGALLIVKNYTGDRLNFGLAAELARSEGFAVETMLVADDVALDVPADVRRGIAGTVLVHKIAGAVAATGAPLHEVLRAARATADAVGTMGVALGPCIVPAAGSPTFTLGEREVELGLGIHGEPGARRVPLAPARDLVAELLATIVARRSLASGARVALLVNDLGGTPPIELDLVTAMALANLRDRAIAVERVFVGRFLTSLEMPGISLSLLPLDDDRTTLLDAPTAAPAWPRPAAGNGRIDLAQPRRAVDGRPGVLREPPLHADGSACERRLRAGLQAVAAALLANEVLLTELDQASGDGDLGSSLARAAHAIEEHLDTFALDDPAATLADVAALLRRVVGGTSGPLYAAFTLRAARRLAGRRPDARAWSDAFLAACDAVAELGGARPGDRTMLDALQPAAAAFAEALHTGATTAAAWGAAVSAAREGADATKRMLARRGRAQYLGERVIGHPDPGAIAAALWLEALVTRREA